MSYAMTGVGPGDQTITIPDGAEVPLPGEIIEVRDAWSTRLALVVGTYHNINHIDIATFGSPDRENLSLSVEPEWRAKVHVFDWELMV